MLNKINHNLLPNETILFHTKKSVIIFIFPALMTVFVMMAFNMMHHNLFLNQVVWILLPAILLVWCSVGLEYATSEYAVTTKRIMMYEGFFNRHIAELQLNTVSQVNVDQSIFGQLFNYGVISFYAFGALDRFSYVYRPRVFQRFINQQLNK